MSKKSTTIALVSPKPRNPFVQHLIGKKQGVHQPNRRNDRRQTKIALRRGDYPCH